MRTSTSSGAGAARLLRRAIVVAAASAAVGAGLVAPAASAAAPDRWTASQGDSGNTAYNAGENGITASTAARVASAWTSPTGSANYQAPVVVDGAALRVVSTGNTNDPSQLTATSATTGATLWTVELPGRAQYVSGLVVSGNSVVVPFNGSGRPGGVLAVDLGSRSVRWTQSLPPATSFPFLGNGQVSWAYTDGERVFLTGGDTAVLAYSLASGNPLWTLQRDRGPNGAPSSVTGVAVGDGRLFVAGDAALLAVDPVTGQRLWTGPAGSSPVVTGGRVLTATSWAVTAVSTGGCGSSSCTPLWRSEMPYDGTESPLLSAADGSTAIVTINRRNQGVMMRLSVTTGAVEWSAAVGTYLSGAVRGADVVWAINDYTTQTNQPGYRLVGFSSVATGPEPLASVSVRSPGYPQQIAVAAGTLFHQGNGTPLVGYRVGAQPATSPALALDTFRRSTTSGLGTADAGGPWTATKGASRLSVTPGAASVSLAPGTSARAHLNGVSSSAVDVTATLSLTAAATGTGVSTYLVARSNGTNQEYRLRARFAADGTVRLAVTVLNGSSSEKIKGTEVTVPGLRPAVGTPVNLRLQVTGTGTTTLTGRAWTGPTEPSDWQITRTDTSSALQAAGSVGIAAALSSTATATPLSVRLTAFRATSVG